MSVILRMSDNGERAPPSLSRHLGKPFSRLVSPVDDEIRRIGRVTGVNGNDGIPFRRNDAIGRGRSNAVENGSNVFPSGEEIPFRIQFRLVSFGGQLLSQACDHLRIGPSNLVNPRMKPRRSQSKPLVVGTAARKPAREFVSKSRAMNDLRRRLRRLPEKPDRNHDPKRAPGD